MSNILLLDRNIDEAERISSYFEARSYAVIWPKTIADLLYHVVHRDFCLAILDVALSAEDDHRFLDALRKVKGVPILSFRVRYGGCGRTPQFSAGRCARISVSAVFDGRMLCASASPHTGVFATHANTERGK